LEQLQKGGYALTLDWEMEKSVLILWEGTLRSKEGINEAYAIIEREGDGYVSLCPELDIASQGEVLKKRETIFEKRWSFFLRQHHPKRLSNVFMARFL